MPNLILIAAVLAAPLPARTPADVIGWFHVPTLGRSLEALERSGARRLVPLLLSAEDRAALARHPEAALLGSLLAVGGESLGGRLVIDAGAAAPGLRQSLDRVWHGRRFEPDRATLFRKVHWRATELLVFGDGRRVGVATDAALVAGATAEQTAALADEPRFVRLHQRAPEAHLVARLDVHRLYGLLARGKDAAAIAKSVERLGLHRLREITATSDWPRANQLHTEVEVHVAPGTREGLLATFGKNLPPLAAPPPGVERVARLSIRPADFYWVAMRLLSFHRPVAYLGLNSQISELEELTGIDFVSEVLGRTPRPWTLYSLGQEEGAAILGVENAAAARQLIDALTSDLPPLLRADFRELTIAGLPALAYRDAGVVAFGEQEVVIGTSAEALATVLGSRDLPEAPGELALVSFAQNDALVVRRYLDTYDIGSERDRAVSGLGITRGAVRWTSRGYLAEAFVTFAEK